MKKEKLILDATAGYRMMWENKQHPNCLYIDNREEVDPDEVQDFRNLPYPDNSFSLVVFDPPHQIRNSVHGRYEQRYGILKCETWQSDLRRGLLECMRVLKPKGVLLFKWSTPSKRVKEVKALLPFKPLFLHTTSYMKSRKKDEQRTVWFCFMKITDDCLR